jgi:hypothetical protein
MDPFHRPVLIGGFSSGRHAGIRHSSPAPPQTSLAHRRLQINGRARCGVRQALVSPVLVSGIVARIPLGAPSSTRNAIPGSNSNSWICKPVAPHAQPWRAGAGQPSTAEVVAKLARLGLAQGWTSRLGDSDLALQRNRGRRARAPPQDERFSSFSPASGPGCSFFCSTEQLPDIQVETPNLGSTHFWMTTQATMIPRKIKKSCMGLGSWRSVGRSLAAAGGVVHTCLVPRYARVVFARRSDRHPTAWSGCPQRSSAARPCHGTRCGSR